MTNTTVSKTLVFLLAAMTLAMLYWTLASNWNSFRGDFEIRYNEITLLKKGINPFDAWQGKIVVEGYKPYRNLNSIRDSVYVKHLEETGGEPEGKWFHAYPPWQYSLLLPLSYFTFETASAIWFNALLVLTAAGLALAYVFGKRLRGDSWDGVLFTSAIFAAMMPGLYFSYWHAQWSPVILAALLAMIVCVEKKRDVLAGLCWAVIMVKPHYGVLLFIPLAISRRWTVIFTAVATCVLLAIPPAIMCRTSPVSMILSVKDLGGGGIFMGNGFVPWPLAVRIIETIKSVDVAGIILVSGSVVGAALCAWVSWLLRGKPWLVRIAAVVIFSMAWSFTNAHDYILYAIPLSVIFMLQMKHRQAVLPVIASFFVVFACSALVITQRENIATFFGMPDEALRLPLAAIRAVLIPLCWAVPLLTLLRGVRAAKQTPDGGLETT